MECVTSRLETGSPVPGVDFNVLRAEITMEQVLTLLGFQPSARSGSVVRSLPVPRVRVPA